MCFYQIKSECIIDRVLSNYPEGAAFQGHFVPWVNAHQPVHTLTIGDFVEMLEKLGKKRANHLVSFLDGAVEVPFLTITFYSCVREVYENLPSA